MEKGNSQNKLVKECIFEAFMILLENKNYHEITVTEITNKAGVSRMAYYRNYNSKDEIIHNHLDELFQEFMNELQDENHAMDELQIAITLFAHFRRHHYILNNLIKSRVAYLLLDHYKRHTRPILKTMFMNRQLESHQEKYEAPFLAGGLLEILIEWGKHSMTESDEEMARVLIGFLPGQSSSFNVQCLKH
jgi:AcrR family transcriptional regulator